MITDILITKAKDSDTAGILAVQRAAFSRYPNHVDPQIETTEKLTADMSAGCVLVATLNGQIVGSVRGVVSEGRGLISRLSVDPNFQRRGYARQLMLAIESALGKASILELYTGVDNAESLALYARCGYEVIATTWTPNGHQLIRLNKVIRTTSIIVVDPQVGFCDLNGSLAATYGANELEAIDQAMTAIASLAAPKDRTFNLVTVISEYERGQHSRGDRQHPLSGLCVPGLNQDCQFCRRISTTAFDASFIKSKKSALSSASFRDWLDDSLRAGVSRFIVCGVLLEHCVQETAIDLRQYVPSQKVEVTVCRDLVASRNAKYRGGDQSVVEEAFRALHTHGVQVQTWNALTLAPAAAAEARNLSDFASSSLSA